MKKIVKIAITGGPGGGKTTALDLFQRELQNKVKVVPEAATMLFHYGIKRESETERIKLLQQEIYRMQLNLEDSIARLHPERLLVCDRGTLDGIAYWPGPEADFFTTIGSSFEQEADRYDAVIFFQTAVKNAEDVTSNNPFRSEGPSAATILDEKLKQVWQRHPNFHYVPTDSSFLKKITTGLFTINQVFLEQVRKHQT
ncbi:MAG: AAA family ATPase [Bacteriovoracaceae bacterium]